jgi:hypothetical protein
MSWLISNLWQRLWQGRAFRGGRRRPHKDKKRADRSAARLRLEQLEDRTLLTGTWTLLANNPGASTNIGTMMLLSDGTVMAQQSGQASNSNNWYKLTPQTLFPNDYTQGTWSTLTSMNLQRLYYASNVLPSGKVLFVGGEYSGSPSGQNWINSGEIFDPTTNSGSGSWTPAPGIAPFHNNTQGLNPNQFGDEPSEALSNGKVLTGGGPWNASGGGSAGMDNTYLYDPSTDQWAQTGTKVTHTVGTTTYHDSSDEESWVKLPDGSILTYDLWSSVSASAATGTTKFYAERYLPSTGQWVDASNVSPTSPPGLLSSAAIGYELGPAFLLPDGRVIQFGGNSNTAFYNPSTNTWSAGTAIPSGRGMDDAPGAMMPNGHILIAADTPLFTGPTHIYEFDPTANSGLGSYTDVTPTGFNLSSNGLNGFAGASFHDRMLVVPSGQVLLANESNQIDAFRPSEAPNDAWRPSITSIHRNGANTVTLTGTQINGISEGAAYGDDAEMSSNYPIVRVQEIFGANYLRTFNWSSTGVAEGSTPESVQFQLGNSGFNTALLNVIANGIASPTTLAIEMSPSFNNITLRVDPSNPADLEILNNGSHSGDVPFSSFSHIAVTCDSSTDTLTVDYSNGNPVQAGGLDYSYGSGVDTLNVNDPRGGSQTWTLGATSVQRSGSGAITFNGGINFVNVNGGSGNNIYNVNGTEDVYATTLNTGSGADIVNVRATGGGGSTLTVDTPTGSSSSNSTVTIGNSGSLAGIHGAVTIHNSPSWDRLTIDDSNDGGNHPAVSVTSGGVSGLAPTAITFTNFSVSTLSLLGGFGTNTYTVNDTPVNTSMTLDSGSSADRINVLGTSVPLTVHSSFVDFFNSNMVNVGNGGGLQNIRGSIFITNNNISTTAVNVDDSGDSTARTGTITATSVTGLGMAAGAAVNYGGVTLASLTVRAGGGVGNIINVESTAAGMTTTVNGGSGGSTINLSPTAHNLANLAGLVNIHGQGGTNALNVFDQATTFSPSAPSPGDILYQDHLVRNDTTARTLFTYGGIQSVNVSAGRGDNAWEGFSVFSTPAGVPVTVSNAGTSTSYVEFLVGNNSQLNDIQGPLTVNGRAGGIDFLDLTDFLNPNPQTYTVTANAVSRTGIAPISYVNQTQLILYTSGHALATVNVQSTAAGALTQIVLLTAGDRATLSAPSIHDLRIAGVAVSVTVDDSSDSMPRTATFRTDPTYRYLLNGLAPGQIFLDVDPGSSIQVQGGSGGNTFNVQSNPAGVTTTVNAGSGNDVVNIGSPANTLDPIRGGITVNGQGANTTLNVHEDGTTAAHYYEIYATSIHRRNFAPPYADNIAPIGYDQVGTVNFYGGSAQTSDEPGGAVRNIAAVFGTAAGTVTNVYGNTDSRSGLNVFVAVPFKNTFGGYDPSNLIQGDLHFHAGANVYDSVGYSDYQDPTPRTYTLTAGQIAVSGSALVTYDSGFRYGAGVDTGAGGGNHVNVLSTAASVSYNNIQYARGDVITVGSQAPLLGGTLANIASGLQIFSPYGTNYSATVILDDSGDTTGRQVTFDNTPAALVVRGLSPASAPISISLGTGSGLNVYGGSGGNVFHVNSAPSFPLTIDGGTGANTLDYSAYTGNVIVDLQTGFATGIAGGLSGNFVNLHGSDSSGPGLYNLLIGNGGNVLTGGADRRNILVAGATASTLLGGNGEDLLIGGTTTYDTEAGLVSWQAIAAYWAGSDDYNTRVNNLESGNGVPLLDSTTVTGNGGGNTMTGMGALALIYTDGADTITGFDPNSQTYTITP